MRMRIWETKVSLWHRIAESYDIPGEADDYLDKGYVRTYRVDMSTFEFLGSQTRQRLTHQSTMMRSPIAPEKRLAMTLHWLAHGLTFDMLGEIYHVGASTAHAVVHESIAASKDTQVTTCIKFPSGHQLDVTMAGFQAAAGLLMYAGAIDGTFVYMLKPSVWGDTFWCYKITSPFCFWPFVITWGISYSLMLAVLAVSGMRSHIMRAV